MGSVGWVLARQVCPAVRKDIHVKRVLHGLIGLSARTAALPAMFSSAMKKLRHEGDTGFANESEATQVYGKLGYWDRV